MASFFSDDSDELTLDTVVGSVCAVAILGHSVTLLLSSHCCCCFGVCLLCLLPKGKLLKSGGCGGREERGGALVGK